MNRSSTYHILIDSLVQSIFMRIIHVSVVIVEYTHNHFFLFCMCIQKINHVLFIFMPICIMSRQIKTRYIYQPHIIALTPYQNLYKINKDYIQELSSAYFQTHNNRKTNSYKYSFNICKNYFIMICDCCCILFCMIYSFLFELYFVTFTFQSK